MDCQWGEVAVLKGWEKPGAQCRHYCELDSRFCERHLRQLAEKAVAVAQPADSGFGRYMTHFALAVIGAMGVAVVEHWDVIVEMLSSVTQHGCEPHPRFTIRPGCWVVFEAWRDDCTIIRDWTGDLPFHRRGLGPAVREVLLGPEPADNASQ